MADAAQDTVSGYADAVKWIVGLSGAVFAGVFLHPEQVAQRTEAMKIYFAVVLFLLGTSMIGGVVFLLWLNRLRNMKDSIRERKGNAALPIVAAEQAEREEQGKQKKTPEEKLRRARRNMNRWYWVLSVPFYLGAFLGVVAFCVVIALPVDKPRVTIPVPLRFTVLQSAVHRTKMGMQAHTFLLNQQTGEIWQMICGPQGDMVEFRRVKWVDVDGKPEKVETGAKP